MQGQSRMDRELLDAGAIAGDLVPAGSVFAFLAERRQELFPDSFIANLFPSATGRCTTAKDGRSMTIHPHEDLLRAARAQARTPGFRQAYPTRAAIERIIAWTATCNGHRIKLRYLGTARNKAWLHTRCAAINLRTLLRHGLTRRDGAWALT